MTRILWSTHGVYGLGLFLMVACAVMGCGDESLPPEEPGVVQVAGTASAGGNPLLKLDVEDTSDDTSPIRLQAPMLNIAQVRVVRARGDGRCLATPDATDSPWLAFAAQLAFNLSRSIELRTPVPCILDLRPPAGQPLITIDGTFEADTPVRVELLTDAALRVRILNPERLSTGGGLMVFDRAAFIQGLELDTGGGGTIVLRDAADRTLRAQLERALVVYADPTPGDDVITNDERTPDNVIALISVFEP